MTNVKQVLRFGIASFVVHAFAVVTPWWSVNDEVGAKDEYGPFAGLWQACYTDGGERVCKQLYEVDDRIQWVRTMEVFAMIAMVVSILCGITKEYVSMYNRVLLKVGAGSGFTAGALMLIGVFIYSWWIAENSGTPHASFGLCIVASIGAIVTGVLFIVWYRAEVDLNARRVLSKARRQYK